MANSPLTLVEETKILALLARGDTQIQIQAIMKEEGRSVERRTIASVKKRNQEHLDVIRTKTLAKEEADAMAIKHQANRTIKKQLDNAEQSADILAKAALQYTKDEISFSDYMAIVKHTKSATLPELVTVSKEMNAQSTETPDPAQSAENLAAIRKALESGDDVELNQIIFKGKNAQHTDIPQTPV